MKKKSILTLNHKSLFSFEDKQREAAAITDPTTVTTVTITTTWLPESSFGKVNSWSSREGQDTWQKKSYSFDLSAGI